MPRQPTESARTVGLRLLPLLVVPAGVVVGWYWVDRNEPEAPRGTQGQGEGQAASPDPTIGRSGATRAPVVLENPVESPRARALGVTEPEVRSASSGALEPASTPTPVPTAGDVFDAPTTPKPIFQALNYIGFRHAFPTRLSDELRAMSSESNDARAPLLLAVNGAFQGESPQALADFEAALARDPRAALDWRYTAGVAALAEDPRYFETALMLLQRAPRELVLGHLRGLQSRQENASPEAARHLERILAALLK